MVNIAFQLVVLWACLTQSGTTVTIRTGDVARQLTEQDVEALELVLPAGAKPWLLNGDHVQVGNLQVVDAYLPPTTATPTLRRGQIIGVSRQIFPTTEWITGAAQSYAQVAIPGRNFDQIAGDQDINRPFRVVGRFDDTELVRLIVFLRSTPRRGTDAIQSWPILSVNRRADDSVEIRLRGAPLQGQKIRLRQAGQDWVIVSVAMWSA
jgi:hypothetical protein